jgi:hypothetical protein
MSSEWTGDSQSVYDWLRSKCHALVATGRWIFDFRRGSAESYERRALESYKQSEPEPAIT